MPFHPIRSRKRINESRVPPGVFFIQLCATSSLSLLMPGIRLNAFAVIPPANSAPSVMLADNGPCQSALANASSSPAKEFLTAYSDVFSERSQGLTAAIDAPPTAIPATSPAPRVAAAAALAAPRLPMAFNTPRLTIFSATSVTVLRTNARPAVIAPPVAYISAAYPGMSRRISAPCSYHIRSS